MEDEIHLDDRALRDEQDNLEEDKEDLEPESENGDERHNRGYQVLVQDLTDNKDEELQFVRENVKIFNS